MSQNKAFAGKYRTARVEAWQAKQRKKKAKRKSAKKNRRNK